MEIFTIISPILAVALLALTPVLWKHFKHYILHLFVLCLIISIPTFSHAVVGCKDIENFLPFIDSQQTLEDLENDFNTQLKTRGSIECAFYLGKAFYDWAEKENREANLGKAKKYFKQAKLVMTTGHNLFKDTIMYLLEIELKNGNVTEAGNYFNQIKNRIPKSERDKLEKRIFKKEKKK
jgi:hypothetical protein